MTLRLPRPTRRLASDRSGLALLEFALVLPIIIALGGYGSELSFLALTNLRISQYALNLADHASRVGVDIGGGVTQLRERDINDVLQGAKLEGDGIKLTTFGRVTLSSLENVQRTYADNTQDPAPVQRIHWQRCTGLKSGAGYDSSAGTTSVTAGTTKTPANAGTPAPGGMGDPGPSVKVSASPGSGVMYVEINYDYQSLFGTMFLSPRVIHYTASFVVRDNRDFNVVTNPDPAASLSTCDKHTA